jgi:hypothetical protein
LIYYSETGEVEIASLKIDDSDGDEYLFVDNAEDMEKLVKAIGFSDSAQFDAECELPSQLLLGRYFFITGKAIGNLAKQPVFIKLQPEGNIYGGPNAKRISASVLPAEILTSN